MKSGPALMKMAKHRIEALQQLVNDADAEVDVAAGRVAQHDATLAHERMIAQQSTIGADFARYAASIKPRRAQFMMEWEQARLRAEAIRADLMEAFAEGKKIELLMERALERERAEEARIEQNTLDEMALRKKA